MFPASYGAKTRKRGGGGLQRQKKHGERSSFLPSLSLSSTPNLEVLLWHHPTKKKKKKKTFPYIGRRRSRLVWAKKNFWVGRRRRRVLLAWLHGRTALFWEIYQPTRTKKMKIGLYQNHFARPNIEVFGERDRGGEKINFFLLNQQCTNTTRVS